MTNGGCCDPEVIRTNQLLRGLEGSKECPISHNHGIIHIQNSEVARLVNKFLISQISKTRCKLAQRHNRQVKVVLGMCSQEFAGRDASAAAGRVLQINQERRVTRDVRHLSRGGLSFFCAASSSRITAGSSGSSLSRAARSAAPECLDSSHRARLIT